MIFSLLWFAHIVGLALWLGSVVVVVWLASSACAAPAWQWAIRLACRISNRITLPAALVVLVGGSSMGIHSGYIGSAPRPLWYSIMEKGGGLLIFFMVPLLYWLGARVVRAAATADSPAVVHRPVQEFVFVHGVAAILAVAVILVVGLGIM